MRASNERVCRFLSAAIGALLCLGAMVGCGREGPPRIVVSGTVTYQGQPVADGEIRFIPAKGTTGPITLVPIVDGRYQANNKGGVPVATHKVQIFAYLVDPASKPEHKGTPMERPKQQYLPAKYNDNSELEFAVEAGQNEVRKDFELAK